jgi:hypothetical protein
LEIDPESTEALIAEAVRHRRNASDQAAVILRIGLGLPFPPACEAVEEPEPSVPAREKR